MVKQQKEQASKITPVYIRDKEHCWAPALQLRTHNGKAAIARPLFKTEQQMLQCGQKDKGQKYARDEEWVDLKEYPNNVLPMQNVDSSGNLDDYKDMVELPFMHEAAILYNLKKRHISGKPYTRTGDILIAVNPYQWFDELYTERKRVYYSNRLVWDRNSEDPRSTMEPHVYEVSALSYKGLCGADGEDQSILVSGESGAGKTETVKICLNHIASTQRGQVPAGYFGDEMDPVVRRVVESNPLLEAFGNAKTRRNDNSSRFGKYLQLQFDKSGKTSYGGSRCALVGSKCEVYLLEKNRVVGHESEERTFHIFYQLLASPDGLKSQFWNKLAGKKNTDFSYVGHTNTNSIEGMSDAERFQETLRALQMVNVTGQSLETLMQAICIVMQLGNIGFSPDSRDSDKSVVSTPSELRDLAELMQVNESDMTLAFTERTFETKNDVHKVPLNAEAAKEACDALAKEAYQKAFLWLVKSINEATCATNKVNEEDFYNKKNLGIIGLLDIFGFEAFVVNRFEQLCINYANEKLQQKFTEDIFRSVQEEYESEGIDLAEIWYDDNTDVLDLIESRTGLLALLNEECVRPKGNDQDFVQKALRANKASKCLIVNRTDRMSFGIHHYAGVVMYDSEFFVSRNQDTLPTDLQDCAEKSSNSIIKAPRSEPNVRKQGTVMVGGRARQDSNLIAPTVWTKYKNQLSCLMGDLRRTRSRYIRCIKPNSQKAPTLMEHAPVVEQLQCAGVVAGITITRSVFPNRLENSIVLARYSGMWDMRKHPSDKTRSMSIEEKRAADCKALLRGALWEKRVYEGNQVTEAFVVGRTRTYFRAGALEWLEANRMQELDVHAVTIQKAARGWLARNQGAFGARQRREMEELERQRLLQEQEARRLQFQQERAARIDGYKSEEDQLKEQLAAMRRQMEASDRETQDAVRDARRRAEAARNEMEELRDGFDDKLKRLVEQPKTQLAHQRKKLEEAKKMIEYLKKEHKRASREHDKVEYKWEHLRDNSEKLNASFNSLGADFDDLNEEAGRVATKNESITDRVNHEKSINKEMKDKVNKWQDTYMSQAEARLELQRSMANILTMIQERCRDGSLVESAVVIALECEGESKAEMAALELATGEMEPDLVGSDVSEGSHY